MLNTPCGAADPASIMFQAARIQDGCHVVHGGGDAATTSHIRR